MRIRDRRWFRWSLAVSIAVGLLAYGLHHWWAVSDSGSEARHIAKGTTIAGFTRTAVLDMSDGDNPPYAEAYFIGPAPKPDLLAIVSVPSIHLEAMDAADTASAQQHPDLDYTVARGRRPDGCTAGVKFVSNPKSTVRSDFSSHPDYTILTDEQIAAVRNHTAVVVELVISDCGW